MKCLIIVVNQKLKLRKVKREKERKTEGEKERRREGEGVREEGNACMKCVAFIFEQQRKMCKDLTEFVQLNQEGSGREKNSYTVSIQNTQQANCIRLHISVNKLFM